MTSPALRAALDNAYEVFALYDAPAHLELGGQFQLRDLSFERWGELDEKHDIDLLMYGSDRTALRWFLPRWLDWWSDDEALMPHNSWSLGFRLGSSKWRDWPPDEAAALNAIFLLWTREAIANPGEDPDLEFLRDAKADVAPHLDLWLRSNLLAVTNWLWMVNWTSQTCEREWVVSSQLENRLETAFFANPDGKNAELFSRSIELIRALRALQSSN